MNATFLFQRDFMDYHRDRFEDYSLMVYKDNKLVALLPANKVGNAIHSHQGLTYGGLLFDRKYPESLIKEILISVKDYLESLSITCLQIKEQPEIYNQNLQFYSTILNSVSTNIFETHKYLAINLSEEFKIHKTKLKHSRKGLEYGIDIRLDNDFSAFWIKVLIPKLEEKHHAKPVHSLEEIERLHQLFPENIVQYNAYINDQIVGGITIFDKGAVVKSQYSASTKIGEKNYVIDTLFLYLINHYKAIGKQFFSMGTVTTNDSLGYSPGLLKQKQELGCSIYEQQLINFSWHD